ncbi:hypothetical protein I4U23_010079 [Adineta vaga]|nr:hypothetical protein I4U23_010079 [Adineta vaga]
MINSSRSIHPTPLFVIDTCPSDDPPQSSKTPIQSSIIPSRSWSLPNCNETYKDLHGAIHQSFSNRLNNLLKRSRSYPNNYLFLYSKLHETFLRSQSPSMSFNVNFLDPNHGALTPGGASSRYSLYGSIFDLSESGYYPPSDNKYLTIDGHPLLVVNHSRQLTSNTYQDKCTNWLDHLSTNST